MLKTKKVIYLGLLMAVLFCACQKSPSSDVIQSKNDGSFDANIVVSDSESKEPDATQHIGFAEVFYSSDGSIEYHLDIVETLTDSNMPVIEVVPHFLTADDAQHIAKAIFGEARFYEEEPLLNTILSKSEIQERISRWSQYTSREAVSDLFGVYRESTVETIRRFIENYNKLLEVAPNEHNRQYCQWEFNKTTYYYQGQASAQLDLSNDNDEIRANVWIDNVPYQISIVTRNKEDFKLNNIHVGILVEKSPEAIDYYIYRASLCRTEVPTQEQIDGTKEKMEKMLKAMGLGQWRVDKCSVQKTSVGTTSEYTICVNAVPVLNGVPALRLPQLTNLKSEDVYASNYYLTDASAKFSANGKLVEFDLTSPIEIKELINDNVLAMSIEKLMEKAKSAFSLMDAKGMPGSAYAGMVDEITQCVVDINSLEYNLIRVKVPDTDESYYYVPGIVLSGNVSFVGSETGTIYYQSETPEILLVLNGIDGSIIRTPNI